MQEENSFKIVVECQDAYMTFVCKIDNLDTICRGFTSALNAYGYTWVTGVEVISKVPQDDDR